MIKADIDDWMDYYNKGRGQWMLEKLSPNEFYHYMQTENDPLLALRKVG
ncbi:IS3 family transposase [Lacrimispora amygdalina]